MLKIEAYIRPSSLRLFHGALVAAGAKGITVWQTKGIGKQYHETDTPEIYRGAEVKEAYIDRVRIDVVIEDDQKDALIAAFEEASDDKKSGTVQLFITPVLESLRFPKN
jgi:nitrogen regulatory protein P-II 1